MGHCSLWAKITVLAQIAGFVAALAQSVSEGSPEEEDLFVARAALQLLAVGKANMLDEKLEDLQELLQSYESMVRRGLPDTPLLHFINLLIKVCTSTLACNSLLER